MFETENGSISKMFLLVIIIEDRLRLPYVNWNFKNKLERQEKKQEKKKNGVSA